MDEVAGFELGELGVLGVAKFDPDGDHGSAAGVARDHVDGDEGVAIGDGLSDVHLVDAALEDEVESLILCSAALSVVSGEISDDGAGLDDAFARGSGSGASGGLGLSASSGNCRGEKEEKCDEGEMEGAGHGGTFFRGKGGRDFEEGNRRWGVGARNVLFHRGAGARGSDFSISSRRGRDGAGGRGTSTTWWPSMREPSGRRMSSRWRRTQGLS